jgi:ribosomal protein S6
MKTDEKNEKTGDIYEIGCLFVPVISDKDVLTEVSNIKTSLENLGCIFLSGDGPHMKELAYPMKKHIEGEKHLFREAHFVWVKFRSASDKLDPLKKDLEKYENILRYILIKTVENDVFASNQKKVFVKAQEEKVREPIKPAKVVKAEDVPVVEIVEDGEKVEKPDVKEIDETIDKLVIK